MPALVVIGQHLCLDWSSNNGRMVWSSKNTWNWLMDKNQPLENAKTSKVKRSKSWGPLNYINLYLIGFNMIQLFRSLDFVHEHLKIQLLGAFLIEVEIFHDTGRMVPRAPRHKWTTKPQGLGESSRARPETQLRSHCSLFYVVFTRNYVMKCSEHIKLLFM